MSDTPFVIERMDLGATRTLPTEVEDWFRAYLKTVDSITTQRLAHRIGLERERLALMALRAGDGRIELLRREHQRRFDAIDNVYWGCMNPECNGDTELHQRIWADRP